MALRLKPISKLIQSVTEMREREGFLGWPTRLAMSLTQDLHMHVHIYQYAQNAFTVFM